MAAVFDFHQNVAVALLRSDMDAAAIWHGLERIRDQVDEHAFHPGALERKLDGLGRHVQENPDALVLRSGGRSFTSAGNHVPDVAVFGAARLPARYTRQI